MSVAIGRLEQQAAADLVASAAELHLVCRGGEAGRAWCDGGLACSVKRPMGRRREVGRFGLGALGVGDQEVRRSAGQVPDAPRRVGRGGGGGSWTGDLWSCITRASHRSIMLSAGLASGVGSVESLRGKLFTRYQVLGAIVAMAPKATDPLRCHIEISGYMFLRASAGLVWRQLGNPTSVVALLVIFASRACPSCTRHGCSQASDALAQRDGSANYHLYQTLVRPMLGDSVDSWLKAALAVVTEARELRAARPPVQSMPIFCRIERIPGPLIRSCGIHSNLWHEVCIMSAVM